MVDLAETYKEVNNVDIPEDMKQKRTELSTLEILNTSVTLIAFLKRAERRCRVG